MEVIHTTDLLIDALVGSVEAAPIKGYPFPHARIHGFLPWSVYYHVARHWPEDNWRQLVHPDQKKADGKYRRRQQSVGAAFPALGAALESREVAEAFRTKFGLQPWTAYPQALFLDDEAGYWIRPHPDTPAKQVTVQIYIAPDESQPHMGTWMLDQKGGGEFIDYLPNSGFAFPVSTRSWHEVRPDVCMAPRRSLQVLYYNSQQPNINYG